MADASKTTQLEAIGTGADPDAAPDPGDDATQNPIEMMVRMASIIVVLGGSVLQGQNGEAGAGDAEPDAADVNDVSGMPDDSNTAAAGAPPPAAPPRDPDPDDVSWDRFLAADEIEAAEAGKSDTTITVPLAAGLLIRGSRLARRLGWTWPAALLLRAATRIAPDILDQIKRQQP